MPINTDLQDALKADPPLRRVFFDRGNAVERDDFLRMLRRCIDSPAQLIYLASIHLLKSDRMAAERIAWLRARTYDITLEPRSGDIIGALGEWAILRYISLQPEVEAVSLVSLKPVSEPDMYLLGADSATGQQTKCGFDIKTSDGAEPAFIYQTDREIAKGNPHIIGLRLWGDHDGARIGDIFVCPAHQLLKAHELMEDKPIGKRTCTQSLNGKLDPPAL